MTVVAIGNMVPIALRAASTLQEEGVEVEILDPRTLSPLDMETIFASVAKTRRLVVADPAWGSFGAAAEIISHYGARPEHSLPRLRRFCLSASLSLIRPCLTD